MAWQEVQEAHSSLGTAGVGLVSRTESFKRALKTRCRNGSCNYYFIFDGCYLRQLMGAYGCSNAYKLQSQENKHVQTQEMRSGIPSIRISTYYPSRPHSIMDKCPPEILHPIFALATREDDGRTGCALSLVSRYIHDTSQSTRYQSVALQGHDKVVTFVEVIYNKPPELRRVKNLFIDTKYDSSLMWGPGLGVRVSAIYSKLRKQEDEANPSLRNRGGMRGPVTNAIAVVLHLVSQTLEFAHIVYSFIRPTLLPEIIGSAPSLRELVLYGEVPSIRERQAASFPSLCHLHLAGHGSITVPQGHTTHWGTEANTMAVIGSAAPRLTHLRVSGVWARDLNRDLTKMLKGRAHVLPTLKRILVQIYPYSATRYDAPQSLRDALSIARHDLEGRIGLFDLNSKIVGLHEQQADWADRIGGSEGCWNETELVELEPILLIQS